MKKIFFGLLFLFSLNCYSQIAGKILQVRPYGEQAAILKPAITGELMGLKEFDDNLRIRYGISYVSFKPRLDTFPVIAEYFSGSTGFAILPGYEVITNYSMFLAFTGYDYDVLKKDNYFLYPGADILIGMTNVEYDTYYQTLSSGSDSNDGLLAGIRLRLGFEYMTSETIGLFLEATHSIYYLPHMKIWYAHQDIGIGVHYIID